MNCEQLLTAQYPVVLQSSNGINFLAVSVNINTMKQRNNRYALITGASGGFGYEFAKLFAIDGYNLVIVSRDQQKLNSIAITFSKQYNIDVLPLSKDLMKPGSAQEIYDEVKHKGLIVDVLINNAGMGEHGLFSETDLQKELDIIQLNIVSLVHLTKLLLKDMVGRNEGKILQLGSTLSVMPTPMMAVYAATKAFVLSFTEALIEELKDTNVTITALMPGASDTDFFHKAGAQNTVVYNDTELADPAEVAREGYRALKDGDRKLIVGLKNKIQAAMSNVLPDNVVVLGMRKMMENKGEEK
jgi:hypothetical protein